MEETGERLENERNKDGTFKENHSPLGGRPTGQKNYATLYREALIKLAELNNKDPNELELEILATGIKKASTDYRFYKDMLDRLHGMPKQSLGIEGELKSKIVRLDE